MVMVVIGSIGSTHVEALIEAILADERVVQRCSILNEMSQMALQRVMDISGDFVTLCNGLCGVSLASLWSEICGSATASMAFFCRRASALWWVGHGGWLLAT